MSKEKEAAADTKPAADKEKAADTKPVADKDKTVVGKPNSRTAATGKRTRIAPSQAEQAPRHVLDEKAPAEAMQVVEVEKEADASGTGNLPSRVLKKGTKLMIADKEVMLGEDTKVHFEGAESEGAFVGLMHVSHPENMGLNKEGLKFRYNGLGIRLPIEEQVDDPADMPKFIKSLTVEEAAQLGVDDALWQSYQPKKAKTAKQ